MGGIAGILILSGVVRNAALEAALLNRAVGIPGAADRRRRRTRGIETPVQPHGDTAGNSSPRVGGSVDNSDLPGRQLRALVVAAGTIILTFVRTAFVSVAPVSARVKLECSRPCSSAAYGLTCWSGRPSERSTRHSYRLARRRCRRLANCSGSGEGSGGRKCFPPIRLPHRWVSSGCETTRSRLLHYAESSYATSASTASSTLTCRCTS